MTSNDRKAEEQTYFKWPEWIYDYPELEEHIERLAITFEWTDFYENRSPVIKHSEIVKKARSTRAAVKKAIKQYINLELNASKMDVGFLPDDPLSHLGLMPGPRSRLELEWEKAAKDAAEFAANILNRLSDIEKAHSYRDTRLAPKTYENFITALVQGAVKTGLEITPNNAKHFNQLLECLWGSAGKKGAPPEEWYTYLDEAKKAEKKRSARLRAILDEISTELNHEYPVKK